MLEVLQLLGGLFIIYIGVVVGFYGALGNDVKVYFLGMTLKIGGSVILATIVVLLTMSVL
jgi:hypothetical protein